MLIKTDINWKELGGANSMAANPTINWANLGDSGGDNAIYSLFVDKNNNVYTAGNFPNTTDTPNFVEMYNGTTWALVGTLTSFYPNISNGVMSVCADGNGNVYAAGSFYTSQQNFPVAGYVQNNWNILEPGNSDFYQYNVVCCDSNGNLYAALNVVGTQAYVAKYVNGAWQTLGSDMQFNNAIVAMYIDSNDTIYVGGDFTNGNKERYVAQYANGQWSELAGLNPNGTIRSITKDNHGNVYAAGDFYDSNNKFYVAKHNGQAWSELGNLNANYTIFSICCDIYGRVYAAGSFTGSDKNPYVAYCITGNQEWYALPAIPNIGTDDQIRSIALDSNCSHLYAGGTFANAQTNCYVAVIEIAVPA